MKRVRIRRPSASSAISVCAVVLACTGTAFAASQIGSSDIKNDSIKSVDIKDKTIRGQDISKKTKQNLKGKAGAPGQTGATGADGATGQTGATGPASAATYVNPEWGAIDRNIEGSPVFALRGGPIVGAAANQKPPLGDGSLGITTADNTEKGDFGNQVDFAGDPVSGLNQVGFSYFVTGEDLGRYAGNTPNITLEIDPSVGGKNYTSMVYSPPSPASNAAWVNEDADANPGGPSGWYFTNGTVSAATGCTQATFCSLSQAQTALVANNDGGPAASIFTVGIGKGKDYQYQGAADALRINSTVYDFEPFGVEAQPVGP